MWLTMFDIPKNPLINYDNITTQNTIYHLKHCLCICVQKALAGGVSQIIAELGLFCCIYLSKYSYLTIPVARYV